MQCTNPRMYFHKKETAGLRLPCGRCRACRIARSREWYVRLTHENYYWEDAIFATFTYSDENLIESGVSLCKEDFQYMIKRLREEVYPRKIKYYGCGEYGEKPYVLEMRGAYPLILDGRPHYHIIIFGVSIGEHKSQRIQGDVRQIIEGPLKTAWQDKGMIGVGSVTKDSMRYVTDYVHKKLYGKAALLDNRVQPFSLCSQGIGKRFCLDNAEHYYYNLKQKVNGVELGMPRYYVKLLGLQDKLQEQGRANAIIENAEGIKKHGLSLGGVNADARKTHELALKTKQKMYGRQEI